MNSLAGAGVAAVALVGLGLMAPSQAPQPGRGVTLQVPPGREAAFRANGLLRRTINFGNMLEAPQEGEWGLKLEERFFDLARSAGFTAIRLPVRWNTRAGAQAPYTVDPAFFARVDWAVSQARRRNLAVILDFHHYEELMREPAAHRPRFLAIWGQVAAHYRNQGPEVLFEVLNEPNGKVEAVWNELQAQALAVIRKSNPRRVVIVGPVGWNSAERLGTLRLPADGHLIVTFHHYTPMEFTHQGTDFGGPARPTGIPWPAGGLRPANGWANWSWDVTLAGGAGGLTVAPQKAYGALYLHRDEPLTGVKELAFVSDRTLGLNVVCLERNDGKTSPPSASITAQAGALTRVPVAACSGSGTLRDLWLMPQGEQAAAPFTLRRLDVVTSAGVRPALGSAQDEVAAPIRTAAAWGRANGRPVFLGEFGAFRAGPQADRARWAAFMRAEAEAQGLSWAWWELASGFGLYDPLKNVWDDPVLRALLPDSRVGR
ncbi:glycoside hydrolase family 5 protein [Deinococcus koreensis]|uniref:Glycoside hydrolase family 5 domain-containing protein n=1 Tax=Deinococcus koreensis TaxID=2054903 RepID=A0A2K3UXM5_9DEIO|nr:glycoside hydrolase family 5 protein [Deinococcus koreensis]PNY81281.1 hypothetical protein CVO96_07665 [Deinococcus koreensis]